MGGAQRHLLHWCLGSEREKWKRAETIVRGEGFYARTQSHDPKPHETGVGIVRKPMKCLLGTTIFCHSVQPPMQFDWCRREYPLSFSVKVLIPLIKQPGSPWATPAAPSDQWLLPPPRPCSLGAPPVAGWALHTYTHTHTHTHTHTDTHTHTHTRSCYPMQMRHFPKVQHPLSGGPLCMLLFMTLNSFKVERTHQHWDGCPDDTPEGRRRRGWCTPQWWPWLGLLSMHWNVWVGLWYPAFCVHPVMLKEFRGEVVKTQSIAKSLPNTLPQSAG